MRKQWGGGQQGGEGDEGGQQGGEGDEGGQQGTQ